MAAWGGLCRQIEIVAGSAGILVRIQILSWPCLLEETWHSFLKLDDPVLVQRLRPCRLQLWMRFQDPFQYRLLVVLEIYKQDMFIVFYGLVKTGKVVVGFLATKQTTLPRAKT